MFCSPFAMSTNVDIWTPVSTIMVLAQRDVLLGLAQLLLFLVSLFLILLILVQRGKGGGLTGALGGMGGQSAFGTKAGDAFTRITIITTIVWITLCMITISAFNPPPVAQKTKKMTIMEKARALDNAAPSIGSPADNENVPDSMKPRSTDREATASGDTDEATTSDEANTAQAGGSSPEAGDSSAEAEATEGTGNAEATGEDAAATAAE